MKFIMLAAALGGCLIGDAVGQDKAVVPFYGNEKCLCGKPTEHDVYATHEGQRIFVCSKDCKAAVKKDTAGALAKAYAKVTEHANERCPVMGKGAQESKTAVFQGHKVRLCCDRCVKAFSKAPNQFLTLALEPDLKRLGNKKCPVMEDEDVVADIFIVYKKQIVGLCCDSCYEDFIKTPEKYLKLAAKSADKK